MKLTYPSLDASGLEANEIFRGVQEICSQQYYNILWYKNIIRFKDDIILHNIVVL